MEQVLSIFLPAWDVELLQRQGRISCVPSPARHDRRPVLLTTTAARQETVARCCSRALAAGVQPGMNLAEARALCPGALMAPFDAGKSRQAMERLAHWCQRFSPTVAVDADGKTDAPDGLLLDVTGEAHLFGGEHLLLTTLVARLGRIGFSARLAIGPTVGAAWALARFGPHPLAVVDQAHLDKALQPLPVAALRLPVDVCLNLRQVGIETVRHLLALKRESLAVRFGVELLRRLDQAFGRVGEPIQPFRVSEALAVHRAFDGATTQLEAILITTQELIAELARLLWETECGVRGMRLELKRINMPPLCQELVLGRPSRDARHLWALLRPKLETAHLGYGVDAVWLTASWTQTIRHQQMGAWTTGMGTDAHDEEYEAFLDTVVNRWGSKRVLAAQPVASHVPEIARHFRPVREPPPAHDADACAILFMDRPSVLFDRPEPAQAIALQPDHPPSMLSWRGEEYRIVTGRTDGEGAERILTTWWGVKAPSTRDYFKVQTMAGLWLWVFREHETARWFVHGLWA